MKVLNIISYIILAVAFVILVIVSYWLLYPYTPLVIKDPVFPILTKEVKLGGNLQFVSDNCKNVNMTAQTTRAFINDIVYYIPTITTNVRKGCGKVIINVPVPSDIPVGEYYIQNIFQYKVNPIRVISVTHNTEMFEIIK